MHEETSQPRPFQLTRRQLLASATLIGATVSGCRRSEGEAPAQRSSLDQQEAADLEAKLQRLLNENMVPGCAAGLVRNSSLIWSGGFGYADVDQKAPMTADTLLNIGSITKTVTATAVLQLIEQGEFALDDDVQSYVDFPVRNPRFPEVAITARQLLVHRSSILDGSAYEDSYACGDRTHPLGGWLAEYFTADVLENHFHEWPPGKPDPPEQPRAYSNVAFGLLGHLVEARSGLSYEDYCRQRIFEPLGMSNSGFRIDRIDASTHAVPYTPLGENFVPGDDFAASSLARFSVEERPPMPGGLHPHCLYSFATPPDGLLRTSVNQLARFLLAWIGRGTLAKRDQSEIQLLASQTVDNALSDQHLGRALCWTRSQNLPGEPLWNHSGGDPGISTFMGFRSEEKSGLILLFNTAGPGPMSRGAMDALLGAI